MSTSDARPARALAPLLHLQRLLVTVPRERVWFCSAFALVAFYVAFLLAAAAFRRNVVDTFFAELPHYAAAKPAQGLPICVKDRDPAAQPRGSAEMFPIGVFGLIPSRDRLVPGLWMVGARAGVAVKRHELTAGILISLRGAAWFDRNQREVAYKFLANDTLLSEGRLTPDAPQLALDLEVPGDTGTNQPILLLQLHVPQAPPIPVRSRFPAISVTEFYVTLRGRAHCS